MAMTESIKKQFNGKMREKVTSFKEHEKFFIEKTGKDFTELYKKYYPKLIYYTSKMCNDPQKTEDIATDSFLTAFEKINKYEMEKAQFSTWLFTIAKNLALQAIKNDKKSVSLDTEYDDEGTTMKDFISERYDDYNNHQIYDSNEIKANIMINHISKLKEPYRKVIEMREIKKMSYQEISDILGENLSTIKSRIRNARLILINETRSEFSKIDESYEGKKWKNCIDHN
jgi:RNA polymerase sigma-70 factor (ECF subfamily)